MIPKVIHYCWFGENPYNSLIIQCIKSWKKFMPDYDIIEWNEENFDINMNQYAMEAYNSGKFAFVTDFVRLFVLYNYGGIYMDTDVEVVKNIDCLLLNQAFSGFEDDDNIQTAIMGSVKHNAWIKKLLDYYDDARFVKDDGSYDLTTNVRTITSITKRHFNIVLNNKYQKIDNLFTLYPKEYFCPKSYKTGEMIISRNTFAIHHFNGSWLSQKSMKERLANYRIIKLFGMKYGNYIIRFKNIYKKLLYYIQRITAALKEKSIKHKLINFLNREPNEK